MKKLGIFGIIAMLLSATVCHARKTYEELKHEHIQTNVAKRKRIEQRDAARMVAKARARTARKKQERKDAIQTALDIEAEVNVKDAYREEIRQFTALMQELTSPTPMARPVLDVVHEAELRIQNICSHNPKAMPKYQERLEYALRRGTHPIVAQPKRQCSNTELMARQSMQTLIDYTQGAAQLVESIATRAQEVKSELNQTINDQRAVIAALNTQLLDHIKASESRIDNSEKRIKTFTTQLAQLNSTLKKAEIEASQKEAEAVSLAQSIDAFNTVSSKFSKDRIAETEQNLNKLEQQAQAATKHVHALTLHLQATEGALDAFEQHVQQVHERHKQPSRDIKKR